MRNAATDLTEGTPWKIIMRFSIPLFLRFLLQQFYNMVDTIVVGQFLGKMHWRALVLPGRSIL